MRIIALGLFVASALFTTPAAAQAPLEPTELEALRGGLATPMGEIGFGASVRTYVDGELALETRLNWTAEGLRTDEVFSSLPEGVVQGLSAGAGSAAPIAITHELSADRIASIVLNASSERTIRQETDITLYMPDLPELQQQAAAARLAGALPDAVTGSGLR